MTEVPGAQTAMAGTKIVKFVFLKDRGETGKERKQKSELTPGSRWSTWKVFVAQRSKRARCSDLMAQS